LAPGAAPGETATGQEGARSMLRGAPVFGEKMGPKSMAMVWFKGKSTPEIHVFFTMKYGGFR